MIKYILVSLVGLALIVPQAEASEKKRPDRNRQVKKLENVYRKDEKPKVTSPRQLSGSMLAPPQAGDVSQSGASAPTVEDVQTGRAAGDEKRKAMTLRPGEAPVPSAPPEEVVPSAPPFEEDQTGRRAGDDKRKAMTLRPGEAPVPSAPPEEVVPSAPPFEEGQTGRRAGDDKRKAMTLRPG